MAQGVAWMARELGVPATVVAPEHAPQTKLDAIARLGGTVIKVPYERWWQTMEEGSYPGVDGFFVHPVLDDAVMAGNGTIGLELVEDLDDDRRGARPVGRRRAVDRDRERARGAAARRRGCSPASPRRAPRVGRVARGRRAGRGRLHAVVRRRRGQQGVLPPMWERARALLAGAYRRHARRDRGGGADAGRARPRDRRGSGRARRRGGALRARRRRAGSSASSRAATSTPPGSPRSSRAAPPRD